jgi:3-phosphoshikimate 1-carboxyvinyltransferase
MEVIIKKSPQLNGVVCAPPSKSYTQRMVIAASLSKGKSKISQPLLSEDTEATIRAVTALGAKVNKTSECWIVQGASPLTAAKEPVDCGESGATLRFMIPVAALADGPSTLIFKGSIKRRPVEPLLESLKDLGTNANLGKIDADDAVFVAGNGIIGGETSIRGDISSQFVSGLMFACPLAKKPTEITLTSQLESADYVKMTEVVLSKHSIAVGVKENFIAIPPNQIYKAADDKVPGDFSSAAFLLAAAAITNSDVTVTNLNYEAVQGDKAILRILKEMGINGRVCPGSIEIKSTGDSLKSITLNVKNIPDLVPAITVLACFAEGTSKISGASRLKLKESDRLQSLQIGLSKMGAKIMVNNDGLTIKGGAKLHGATIDPHNDHRIAMACSVAALGAEGSTIIKNAKCIRKSYPQFFSHLKQIGAHVIGGKFDR